MTYQQQPEMKRQMTYIEIKRGNRSQCVRVCVCGFFFAIVLSCFWLRRNQMTIGNINLTRTHPRTHAHWHAWLKTCNYFWPIFIVGQIMIAYTFTVSARVLWICFIQSWFTSLCLIWSFSWSVCSTVRSSACQSVCIYLCFHCFTN